MGEGDLNRERICKGHSTLEKEEGLLKPTLWMGRELLRNGKCFPVWEMFSLLFIFKDFMLFYLIIFLFLERE